MLQQQYLSLLSRLYQHEQHSIDWYEAAAAEDDRFEARVLDLPINMVLTHTYLSSLYGDAVAGLWDDSDRPSCGHRALVVPPWRLASLRFKVDLAVNTLSFQHMVERNHRFYGDAMRVLGTRRVHHVNHNVHVEDWDTMTVTADRYRFMADYAVVEANNIDDMWVEVIADARS